MGSDGARCLKVGDYTINRLTGDLSRAPSARVWRGIRGPSLHPEKMNLGLADMQFPAVLGGLTCTL